MPVDFQVFESAIPVLGGEAVEFGNVRLLDIGETVVGARVNEEGIYGDNPRDADTVRAPLV